MEALICLGGDMQHVVDMMWILFCLNWIGLFHEISFVSGVETGHLFPHFSLHL